MELSPDAPTGGGGSGVGDGISKYPFGDSSYSLWLSKPHCGGGGGGPYGTARDDTEIFNAGASGYQGIVYMRIPEEQAA